MAFGLKKGATIAADGGSKHTSEMSHWTAPVLLGGLVPSLFALVIVVLGQFILLAETPCTFQVVGMEGMTGDNFMRFAVMLSYAFLIVFTWIFMGTTVTITPLPGKKITILKPFSRLRTIVILYIVIAFLSFLVFAMGTIWVAQASECQVSKRGCAVRSFQEPSMRAKPSGANHPYNPCVVKTFYCI